MATFESVISGAVRNGGEAGSTVSIYDQTALPDTSFTWHTSMTNWVNGQYNSSSANAMPTPSISGSKRLHITKFEAIRNVFTQNHPLMIFDVLSVDGTPTFTTTGVKTLSMSPLPRYTSGRGVLAGLFISSSFTIGGSLVVNLNSYTNESGVTGRTGPTGLAISSGTNGGHFVMLPVQSGDLGIRTIASVNVTTAPSTSANAAIILFRPIFFGNWSANSSSGQQFIGHSVALTRLEESPSLFVASFWPAGAGQQLNLDQLIVSFHSEG